MNLKSIPEEAADCRAAFAAMPAAKCALHVHHEQGPVERLEGTPEARISYILDCKPKGEQALRLRLFRPISEPAQDRYDAERKAALDRYDAETQAAWDRYHAEGKPAHDAICQPGCPWDGKTIFGGAK